MWFFDFQCGDSAIWLTLQIHLSAVWSTHDGNASEMAWMVESWFPDPRFSWMALWLCLPWRSVSRGGGTPFCGPRTLTFFVLPWPSTKSCQRLQSFHPKVSWPLAGLEGQTSRVSAELWECIVLHNALWRDHRPGTCPDVLCSWWPCVFFLGNPAGGKPKEKGLM